MSDSTIYIGYGKYGKARGPGTVVTTQKKKPHQGIDHQLIAKLDRNNEVSPPKTIKPSVARAIQNARQALELSQADLAKSINEKLTVVQDYESGKAIPNPQVLSNLERILDVKLRGNDIGKKLETPKK